MIPETPTLDSLVKDFPDAAKELEQIRANAETLQSWMDRFARQLDAPPGGMHAMDIALEARRREVISLRQRVDELTLCLVELRGTDKPGDDLEQMTNLDARDNRMKAVALELAAAAIFRGDYQRQIMEDLRQMAGEYRNKADDTPDDETR